MHRPFWTEALERLHPAVQERYAFWFHRAEAWERGFDEILVAWRELRRNASWLLFRTARILHPDLR